MTENSESEKSLTLQLEEKIRSLEAEHKNLLAEKQSNDERYDLVASILNAKPRSFAALEEFKRLVREDYREFAATENALADDAGVLLALQDVIIQLEEIVRHPTIVKKQVIAIGGGFSSGKSSFINSLFAEGSPLLPTSINPATAIPAYVSNNVKNTICGYATNGGSVPLTMELYRKLSHNYLEQFKFNLKDQLSFVSITAKMNKEYTHLCFIDTPGFNAASAAGNQTADDMEIARSYLSQADALIWVVGVDATGTFDRESLDFLGSLVNNGAVKKLFIVLNKCDLKPEQEILEILSELKECLNNEDIDYVGISAYSSRRRKEYANIGDIVNLPDSMKVILQYFGMEQEHKDYVALEGFLDLMNQPNYIKRSNILSIILEKLKIYDNAIREKIVNIEGLAKALKNFDIENRNLVTSLTCKIDEQFEEIRYLKKQVEKADKDFYAQIATEAKYLREHDPDAYNKNCESLIELRMKLEANLEGFRDLNKITEQMSESVQNLDQMLNDMTISNLERELNTIILTITKDLDRRSHEENLATLEKLRNNMTQTVELLFAEIQQAEVLSV